MFYYLRGYDSHLIVQDIGKNVRIYVKIDVMLYIHKRRKYKIKQ